jgi:NADPH-dependent 2,4-dienoyl-CoA reductase/sulfur reductase-like enzyme
MAQAIAADGRIVIVGGGVGGAHACQQARRQGFSGSITLLSAEHEVPYDRPPLSKTVLAGTRDQTRLPIDYDALGIDVRTATTA